MSDIRLNPTTGDLDLSEYGLILTPNDVDALAQSLIIRLKYFKGEWFLNPAEGVDYYGTIFVKSTSKSTIDSIFQQRILSTVGVAKLLEYESVKNDVTRTFTLNFTVKLDTGANLTLTGVEV